MSFDTLFPNSYPRQIHHGFDPISIDRRYERTMQIHLCRSHFGELLLVGATTGRTCWPEIYNRESWAAHQYPQMNTPGGWRTRFHEYHSGLKDPGLVIALYYKGARREECEHGFYDLDYAYALVQAGEGRRFMHAPAPQAQVNMLVDDGLWSMHDVFKAICDGEPELNLTDIPHEAVGKLQWGISTVEQLFGQGRIPSLHS